MTWTQTFTGYGDFTNHTSPFNTSTCDRTLWFERHETNPSTTTMLQHWGPWCLGSRLPDFLLSWMLGAISSELNAFPIQFLISHPRYTFMSVFKVPMRVFLRILVHTGYRDVAVLLWALGIFPGQPAWWCTLEIAAEGGGRLRVEACYELQASWAKQWDPDSKNKHKFSQDSAKAAGPPPWDGLVLFAISWASLSATKHPQKLCLPLIHLL